jgi:hypothetical protein
MFANSYLAKNNVEKLIRENPDKSVGIIVVIPCLREPDIDSTLNSLQQCTLPKCNTEIIVVINHSEVADEYTKAKNSQTKKQLDSWMQKNNTPRRKVYVLGPIALRKKWAGAGLARKYGMDEAALRFNHLHKPNGIIVSLDADTLVEKNYLLVIEKHFVEYPKQIAATIDFEHQKNKVDGKLFEGIELYEQYMNYYKNALAFTTYPYPMFTVGSAFAVKAEAYVRRGGMNRRQAGEDFYFLQNLTQFGTVGEIVATKVYPSARLSNRVPFGTGPILQKWINGEEDLTLTYNFEAFKTLRILFQQVEEFFACDKKKYELILAHLPSSVAAFLAEDNFFKAIDELNQNCSNVTSFKQRFFQKFNAFKILKYLNFVHEKYYLKVDLAEQINKLNQEQQA